MLRVDKVIKPWKDSACLNDHINLYCFWNETAFLTKSGDVGMVLSVPGVDYEISEAHSCRFLLPIRLTFPTCPRALSSALSRTFRRAMMVANYFLLPTN